jgi:tRNA(adenine34) deaminase
MCAGALYWSQLGKIIYGAPDIKRGALRHDPSLFHPSTTVIGGVEEDTCITLIRTFFEGKR